MKQNNIQERSYTLSLEIIKFIETLNKKDFTVNVISRQLLRSATSVGANITEAQAGSSRKDFTNFYNHALKSANESAYWIRLLKDSNKADLVKTEILMREILEIANILGASIRKLRTKQ